MTTFHIILSPQRRDDRLRIEKQGSSLILNGEIVDFSSKETAASSNQWIVGLPEKTAKGWELTIILPYGYSAPRSTRFPEPILVSEDGEVDLPVYEGPNEDHQELLEAVLKKLAERKHHVTSVSDTIKIPKRFTLSEMPEGVYFSETPVPFAKHPSFGAVVANVISTVSSLDLEMLKPAVSQHGSDALLATKTAFTVLDRDQGKRRAFIKSISRNSGKELVWDTIDWAFKFSKPLVEVRNRFAHHIWGVCPHIPGCLLLVDPMDQLTGKAALSQLLSHLNEDKISHTLVEIATGQGGSKLSGSDAMALGKIAAKLQHAPKRLEAFNMSFGNPLNFKAPSAEVWTANDFNNVALAAALARERVIGRLQKIVNWLDGMCTEEELEPLPSPFRRKQTH